MNGLAIKLETLNNKREGLVFIMGVCFFAIIAASLFISANFGYFLIVCLVLAMAGATILGRYWCNWLCPRGSFLEYFLARLSRQKTFPPLFKQTYFLVAIVSVFMLMMGLNFFLLSHTHSAIDAMGITLTRLLVISTIAAIILGITYEPRAWCVFCPGATFAKLSAGFKSKRPYLVNDVQNCTSCGLCAERCMFHIDASQSGVISDPDCLKCSTCIKSCPAKALKLADNA